MKLLLLMCLQLYGARLYNTNTSFTHDASVTNITNSAWVEIKTDVETRTSAIEIFQTTGLPLYMGFSTDSSDPTRNHLIIHPVGIDKMDFSMPPNADIFVKAVSDSATSGVLYFNLFREPGTVVDR